MRIFLAGATGAIGRPLVPRLLGAGHAVVALTRSAEKAAALRAAGAEPVVGNVFETPSLNRAVADARPDVVICELTDLPRTISASGVREAYERNNRVRREGTRNLVAAARGAGARRFISESVAFWYAPDGAGTRTEDDPIWLDAPDPIGTGVAAMHDAERAVLDASDLEGIVLRYGFFYGPGTWIAKDGAMTAMVAEGKYPIVGSGRGVYSFIHVDDAASATAAFVERGRPGIYNIVDDEPAETEVWLPEFAAAIGAPKPKHVPEFMAAMLMGRGIIKWMTSIPPVSNAKAKQEVGWQPRFSSRRQGFVDGL